MTVWIIMRSDGVPESETIDAVYSTYEKAVNKVNELIAGKDFIRVRNFPVWVSSSTTLRILELEVK